MTNGSSSTETSRPDAVIPREMLFPFALVTTLFALWGFANDVTNPLVKAFQQIFLISNKQSSLVQTAFYGGYATMALPAAIFIRRYSYKAGILVGLALYAIGAFLFIPASFLMEFWLFLLALYVLTFGLAFLETTANPYILAMGPASTATRRLNFAQAFNPIGSLVGMVVASSIVLAGLGVSEFRDKELKAHPEYQQMLPSEVDARITQALREFQQRDPEGHREMQARDLQRVRIPYVAIGVVVTVMLIVFAVSKLPRAGGQDRHVHFFETAARLLKNGRYLGGVVAQTFYVGAQIMCWTFIIHYAMANLKMSAAQAQNYNVVAMTLFCTSRFVCTYLLKYVSPGGLLGTLALGGMALTAGTVFLEGMPGLYCLIGISGCMSLMFPTIYGIALHGLGDDAKLGSAGLIFAIVGGALMPPLQGAIIDFGDQSGNLTVSGFTLPAVSASFVLPFICFVVIAVYGFLTHANRHATAEAARA
ncbi:MAG: L-fucose:H+ symporter permease [Planctomycetes bacterium]|nr:L-fucose:H+ symporter permease [Planctomycetota bacterium]